MDHEKHINLVPITTQPATRQTISTNTLRVSLQSSSTEDYFLLIEILVTFTESKMQANANLHHSGCKGSTPRSSVRSLCLHMRHQLRHSKASSSARVSAVNGNGHSALPEGAIELINGRVTSGPSLEVHGT